MKTSQRSIDLLKNEKIFLSLRVGDTISKSFSHSEGVAFTDLWIVQLDSTLAGNIPKTLFKTAGDKSLPFFVHFWKNKLINDDGQIIADLLEKDLLLTINRKQT